MPWIQKTLHEKTVYARAKPSGELITTSDGKVDVIYQPKAGAKIYRALARNLAESTGQPEILDLPEIDSAAKPASGKAAASGKAVAHPAGSIIVYTDGACTGNPGPMALGVVIINGKERKELSEYLGTGTNNIAELTAILRALETLLEMRDEPVCIHADSMYAIGLLRDGWKAKANQELVAKLREVAAQFSKLTFVHVRGHAGVTENERCDELARMAIQRGR